jgi:RHH-type rel operon transcriptional repressor/antitoxin RelB
MVKISTQLPDDVANRLTAIAKRTRRSIDYHILQALLEYLSDQSAVDVAHKRYTDKKMKRVPLTEVKEKLGL